MDVVVHGTFKEPSSSHMTFKIMKSNTISAITIICEEVSKARNNAAATVRNLRKLMHSSHNCQSFLYFMMMNPNFLRQALINRMAKKCTNSFRSTDPEWFVSMSWTIF